jgi:hypothetical protein
MPRFEFVIDRQMKSPAAALGVAQSPKTHERDMGENIPAPNRPQGLQPSFLK